MAALLEVGVTDGIPDTGTGEVMTLNAIAALLPAALGAGGGLKTEIYDAAGNAIDQSPPATGTITSVNDDNDPEQTILAANANRWGASVFNDSTAILYLTLSNVAATTSVFTCKVAPQGYYEVPYGYTGIIRGIWAADASGAARVTEFT